MLQPPRQSGGERAASRPCRPRTRCPRRPASPCHQHRPHRTHQRDTCLHPPAASAVVGSSARWDRTCRRSRERVVGPEGWGGAGRDHTRSPHSFTPTRSAPTPRTSSNSPCASPGSSPWSNISSPNAWSGHGLAGKRSAAATSASRAAPTAPLPARAAAARGRRAVIWAGGSISASQGRTRGGMIHFALTARLARIIDPNATGFACEVPLLPFAPRERVAKQRGAPQAAAVQSEGAHAQRMPQHAAPIDRCRAFFGSPLKLESKRSHQVRKGRKSNESRRGSP